MFKRALVALSLCGCAGAAAAETAYVTDILRLGIHVASDTSDAPFDSLVSGAPLEVLERTSGYARVRTAEGREGWVKSAYLVTTKPALTRVAELEAEVATLQEKVAAAHAARAELEQEARRLGAEAADGETSAEAIKDTLARLKRDNESYEARLEAHRGSLPLKWVAAALVLAVAAGFVAGLWWLDSLIRRRHGGFRIW